MLNEWPPSRRNPPHAIALNACKAALGGDIDRETALATFVAFARKNDLLVPQPEFGSVRTPDAQRELASPRPAV